MSVAGNGSSAILLKFRSNDIFRLPRVKCR